jgi:Ca2+-binding RTX toxin-like protein
VNCSLRPRGRRDDLAGHATNDVISGGADDDRVIGDQNPFCGTPSGRSGNDSLSDNEGRDELHGDSYTDTGNPVFDSGDGTDGCDGGAGNDTAALCEFVTNVP